MFSKIFFFRKDLSPISTGTITKKKSIWLRSEYSFTYCLSKSPPCNMNCGITRWKLESLYPKPRSPVHNARKFSNQNSITLPLNLLHTCSLWYYIIVELIKEKISVIERENLLYQLTWKTILPNGLSSTLTSLNSKRNSFSNRY